MVNKTIRVLYERTQATLFIIQHENIKQLTKPGKLFFDISPLDQVM